VKVEQSLRTFFLIKYFGALKKHGIKFAVLRGYKKLFQKKNKDIDLLMNPVDYGIATSLYKELVLKYGAICISSIVSNKNLYLKSLFINDGGDEEIEGLYIHITAYITVKTCYETRNQKFRGHKIWIDDFKLANGNVQGVLLPVPEATIRLLLALTKYAQKMETRYLNDVQEIITNHSLHGWVKEVDKNNCINALLCEKKKQQASAGLYFLINDIVKYCGIENNAGRLQNYAVLIGHNIRQMFSYKGKLIFFSGPDGSGKTTANEALTNVLTQKLKIPIINNKHLYPVSNKTSRQGQKLQAKVRRIDFDNKNVLERDRGRGWWWTTRRLVGLLYILIQIWPGYIYGRYKNFRGYTVMIDTSFFDAFIKGHRPRFPFLQRISIPFIPCGDHWFLMFSHPQTIVSRKPELTVEEIEEYYERMAEIANMSRCHPVKIPSSQGVNGALKHMIVSL